MIISNVIIRLLSLIFLIFSFKKINISVPDKKNKIAIQQIVGFLVAIILILVT